MFRNYLLVLLAGLFLHAQVQPVGTVDGSVIDGSGGSLAGVKVTLRNVETGVARDTMTNENGNYFFPLVNPGRYETSVEKTGFKKSVQEVLLEALKRKKK